VIFFTVTMTLAVEVSLKNELRCVANAERAPHGAAESLGGVLQRDRQRIARLTASEREVIQDGLAKIPSDLHPRDRNRRETRILDVPWQPFGHLAMDQLRHAFRSISAHLGPPFGTPM
jgi:hypothetical protein